jgi:hypothetical protein
MAIINNSLKSKVATVNMNDPYPGIEARPLQRTDFVNIKPKNPMVSIRFVNRVAGGGQRLDQMVYAGFVPVKPEEVVMENGAPLTSSLVRDGQVIFGDLICMKIDRRIYDGAKKHNWKRAVDRLHPSAQVRTGQEQLKTTLREAGAAGIPDLNKKIQAFRPSSGEMEKLEKEEDGQK